jgi:hypothetical protein
MKKSKKTFVAKPGKSLEPCENRELSHRTPETALFLLEYWAKEKSHVCADNVILQI